MEKTIEIPFGVKDSELKGWEYTIPEDMEAEIKEGKIIVKQKESEDERIRKEIIRFINWAELRGSVRNYWFQKKCPAAEWIAYLERQKEQKPLPPVNSGARYYFDEWIKQQPIPKYWDAFIAGIDFNKKEQKPAEWSDYDEEMIKACIAFLQDGEFKEYEKSYECIDFLKSLSPRSKNKWSCQDWAMLGDIAGYIDGSGSSSGITNQERVDFLYELPRRFNLQHKQAWSAEDKVRLISTIQDLEYSRSLDHYNQYGKEDIRKNIAWLRSFPERFCLQPKMEWSEEDRDFFDSIIDKIEINIDKCGLSSSEFSWLKSLCPKPKQEWSEEDKLKLDNLIGLVEEIKRQPLKRLEDWDGYINWLKSLLERFSLQPKQEWSEEDEHCMHQLILFCENCIQQDSEAIRCSTWLKSLRPQPHWKPSEEDLTALEYCVEHTCPELLSLYLDLKKL